MNQAQDLALQIEADPEQMTQLDDRLGELRLPREYVPVDPTAKQEWFLMQDAEEVFAGGSAGGGKTWSMLMSALQYVESPRYSALLIRPSLTEFYIPSGIHELAQDWLGPSPASFVGGPIPQWRFPSGATVSYGFMQNVNDISRYKGGALAFIGFDELVGFTLRQYLATLRLLRSGVDTLPGVPMRVRSASNPSTEPKTMVNQAWIKQRFIDPGTRPAGVVFVPSSLADNPHLDRDEYIGRLRHMLPADRERLIYGNWDIMEEGALFRREWIVPVPRNQLAPAIRAVRYWDLAATEASASNVDPDWTTGLKLQLDATGVFTITDLVRGRYAAHVVETVMKQAAAADGPGVAVRIEQEPGASGKLVVSHFIRQVLRGYDVKGQPSSGDKMVRARPVAAAAGNGLLKIVEGCPNTMEFLDEVCSFGEGARHDDCIDALSGAHTALTRGGQGQMKSSVPRGRIPGVELRAPIPSGGIARRTQ